LVAGLFRAIAADIDGTLTLRRGDVRLSVNAIKGIREAERAGVKVILVSGNSLPVTLGLRTYLGASGPAVAENGCLVFHEGQVIHVCEGRVPQELVDEAKSLGLIESWQNPYRVHDVAFYVPRGLRSLDRVIAELRESASRRGLSVLWSGYAVHINTGRGKAVGVAKAIELLGLSPEEVAALTSSGLSPSVSTTITTQRPSPNPSLMNLHILLLHTFTGLLTCTTPAHKFISNNAY